jgi:hypothetical protein
MILGRPDEAWRGNGRPSATTSAAAQKLAGENGHYFAEVKWATLRHTLFSSELA